MGCGTGRVDSVKFVHVESLAHFLAEEAFVSEIPTVEVAVVVAGLTSCMEGVVRNVTGLEELPVDHALGDELEAL